MAEKEPVMPVKLAELRALADKYEIGLNIRGMGSYKEVHASRGRMKEYQWRKMILRLKAAGFVLIEGQGEWYGVLNRSGKKWGTGPFHETFIIPA